VRTVFDLFNDFKRSQLEITTDVPYHLLRDNLVPYNGEKLPEDVTFKVATGKMFYDIIRLYECGQYFFSQKFIDVLSQFIDMSEKCYPIHIWGVEEKYYAIYNLEVYQCLNDEKASYDEEPYFYEEKEDMTPLFTVPDSLWCYIVTEELKNALIKNKISNIYFKESFLCTKEEYKQWKKSQK